MKKYNLKGGNKFMNSIDMSDIDQVKELNKYLMNMVNNLTVYMEETLPLQESVERFYELELGINFKAIQAIRRYDNRSDNKITTEWLDDIAKKVMSLK